MTEVGRRTRACIAALALAVVPGALHLVPGAAAPDRAPVVDLPVVAAEPVGYSDDVAITPPPASFSGPVADLGAPPATFQAARTGGPGVFALVIGIDDYPGSSHDLGSAVADADIIDAALTGFGVPAENRVVLRNGQARKPVVVGALRALAALGDPSATVVFAYAGHTRKLDRDTEAMVAADGALITDQELADLLAPTRARHVWLLMATCFAGGFTEALGPGRILTGAADASSLAYESPSLHASYLVHHLVREGWLQGRAGPSVQDAFAFASGRLADQRPERRPVQIDQSGEPLVLGGGDPRSAAALAPPAEPEPAPSSPPPGSPPPTAAAEPPPTTAPPKPEDRCTLIVLCRR